MKRRLGLLAGVLLLGGALVAAAFWLTTTAGGFRWLAGTLASASGGRVEVAGIEGPLGGPLRIRRLAFVTATQRIEIEDLRVEWQPRALWDRVLDVDLLAAQRMRVIRLREDLTPPTLPASLRLPLRVRVRALDLARLDLVDGGTPRTLGALRGRLDDDGMRYRLSEVRATTPWGDLQGEATVDKDAPFAVGARLDAASREPFALAARAGVAGTLAALQFRVDAQADAMKLMVQGEAAPFAAVRLPRLLVAGEGIDPRRLVATAPAANLAFSGIFEGRPGERLLGSFSLHNTLAGRLDQQRLPLTKLAGAVFGDLAAAEFSALTIDLGAAGQLTGNGQWRDGRFALRLASPRLDLAGLHQALHATRLATTLRVAGDASRQTLDGEVSEAWGQGRFTLTHAERALRLENARFSGEQGRLTGRGTLQLDATRGFVAEFDAAGVNPARFGRFPRARLNARGEVRGALAPALRLQTQFVLPAGELEGRPVSGHGRLRYEARHLSATDVDLDLAGNRARVQGAWGRAGDRLRWDVDAPALGRLGLGISGRLRSAGSLGGDPARPQLEAQASASGLKLPGDVAVDALALQLNLQAAANGAFDGTLDARDVRVAGHTLAALRAALRGRRDAHTLALDARPPAARLTASLAGGLDAGARVWRGQLRQAAVEGTWPMRLTAPARLLLARERQQVDDLAFTLAGGEVAVARLERSGAQWATRGRLGNLPVAPLLGLLAEPPPFATDLRVDGEWNLQVGDTLAGDASLQRRSGDVRLNAPALALGLTRVALSARGEQGRVRARLLADSREGGTLRADGEATLARDGAGFALVRSAPLAWTAQADVPDLRLAKPFLPVGVRADARLTARLQGGGSLAAPRVDGRVDASGIRFSMVEEGIAITDGHLGLLLAGDRVQVREGVLQGHSGRITVSGEARLREPQAGLLLGFEQFAATQRSDRRVVVSGSTRLALAGGRLQLSGELTADRARIEMPEASRPELAEDVVVGRAPRPPPVARRFPLALDLQLGLGKDFLFTGGGLDARLGGALRVFTVEQAVRGEGTIRVEKGRYAAYAQTLDIERGVLRFAGPLDNPGLDVLAVRKTGAVTAGVQVGGSLQRPLVKLYADPAMPDTEKLAWLVLGHGLESSGQQEAMLLQLAAGALLSQSESARLQAKLVDALGIESLGVRPGEGDDLASTVVSVGMRVSSRATLAYEQSLDGLSQVVKVLYQLTPQVRLEAQAGQQSSFDAFYTLDYD